MARRRSKRVTVRGKPNYLWISSAGELAQIPDLTVWDAVLIPADWSGTVTETQCTLLRMVLSLYCVTGTPFGGAHASNCVITIGNASEAASSSTSNIDLYTEWPDFFSEQDRVLRIHRLEWSGLDPGQTVLPVQFTQVPDPVVNLRTPRVLKGDDSIRLCVGGGFVQQETEVHSVHWFARSLVRTGLR